MEAEKRFKQPHFLLDPEDEEGHGAWTLEELRAKALEAAEAAWDRLLADRSVVLPRVDEITDARAGRELAFGGDQSRRQRIFKEVERVAIDWRYTEL